MFGIYYYSGKWPGLSHAQHHFLLIMQIIGLSDLHQMRGRVVEATKGFLLLINPSLRCNDQNDARKRNQALEQFNQIWAAALILPMGRIWK